MSGDETVCPECGGTAAVVVKGYEFVVGVESDRVRQCEVGDGAGLVYLHFDG